MGSNAAKPGGRAIDAGALADLTHHEGRGPSMLDVDRQVVNAADFHRIGEFFNLAKAMERRTWPERRIRRILGANRPRTFAEL